MRFFSRSAGGSGVTVVADEAALLASGLEPGRLAYREDTDKVYLLASGSAGTLGNWSELVGQSADTGVFGSQSLQDAVSAPAPLSVFLLAGM